MIISGFWVLAIRMTHQAFKLVRLLILARILAPNDFGLLGIALLTLGAVETFSKTGFEAALIQRKDDIRSYLDSAWTILVLRGVILFVILYLIAPHVAVFFDTPEAKPIIRVIGYSILFKGFTNIGIIYFQKDLEFNKQFIYRFSGTLADFIVAVSAALILRNAWALVVGLLAGNLVEFLMSYIIHPYRPRLSSDFKKAKDLWGFGRWVLGSSMLIFLVNQGNDIMVGKVLGATALGFYLMAYRISTMPSAEISHMISQVIFPAYSKLQNDMPRLREAFLKVTQLTAFLSFPIAGLIVVLAPDFARIFLGEKWLAIVPAMQVLACAGPMRSIAATFGYMFYAIGRPKTDTAMQILRLSILSALILPFTLKWNILGTSIVVLLNISIPVIVFSLISINITKCGIKKYANNFLLPLINMIIVVLLVQGLKTFVTVGAGEFVALACTGIFSYLLLTYYLDSFFKFGISPLIRERVFASIVKR